jgi:hypothetical protein
MHSSPIESGVLFEVQFSRWKWGIGKVVIKGYKSSVGLGEIVLGRGDKSELSIG